MHYSKFLIITVVSIFILLVLSLWHIHNGAFSISIFEYLTGASSPQENTIITSIRLPRLLVAISAGAALTVAGALVQGLFKNPLASTGILGTDSAATLGAIMTIFLGITSQNIICAVSFFISLTATFIVYGVSKMLQNKNNQITTLILCGIGISTLCTAASSIFLSISLEDWDMGKRMILWGFGSLENMSWAQVKLMAPIIILCFIAIIPIIKNLNLLNLDDETAQSLGVNLTATHIILITVSSVLASIIVSITGMIGFIGLICPHIVRAFTGNNYMKLLPLSALVGAIFMVAADTTTIVLKNSYQVDLKIGILTTLIGVPLFISLLFRKNLI